MSEGYHCFLNGDDNYAGVGVVIAPWFRPYIQDIIQLSDRIIRVEVRTAAAPSYFFGVCAPTMKDEHADLRTSFWSTLQAQLATIPPRAMVGVFGDLNVRLRAKRSFEEVIGPYVFGQGPTYIEC